MSALNSQENNSGLLDQNIPQWKRELILKRRALGRTLQAGNVCMKLTCPTTAAPIGRNDDSIVTAGVAENISGKQQRCTSSVVAVVSNKSSLDQNEADFHPGSSSSSASSVLNMRLVEVDHRLRGTNDLVSGTVSATNKVMLDNYCAYKCVVNTNNKMGEEKSITIKRPNNGTTKSISENKYIVKRKQQTRSAIVKSVSENKTTMEEDECNSDSSEELKYGPGIVNKLKTKYLSMTLRENQKRGVRPSLSNLRRATSLENMLEDDNVKSQQNITSPTAVNSNNVNTLKTNGDKTNNKPVNNNRSAVISYPYNFSRTVYGRKNVDSIMKRACSMDTLLHSDNNIQPNKSVIMRLNKTIEKDSSGINCKKTIASIANEDLIIVENNTPCNKDNTSNNLKLNNHESKITTGLQPSQRNTRTLKTSISVEEKELPPPDVVKQTLKKFESAPKTKSNVLQNKNISKTVNLQNNNNKPLRTINRGTNSSVIQNDKQISMLNKPVLSPKPILNTTEKRTIINRSSKILSPKSSPSVKINNNSEKCNVMSKTDTSQQKTNIIKSVIPENRPCSVVNNSKEVINTVVCDNGVTNDKIVTPQQKNQTSSVKNVQNIKSVVCVASNNENSTNLLEDSVSPVVNNLKTDQKSVESDAVTSSSSSTAVLLSSSSDLSDDNINNSDEDIDEVDSKTSVTSKSVSPSALENIRKGGTSLKFNFKTSSDEDDSKNILKKSYLPTSRDPPTAQATNTSLLTSQATSPIIKGLTTSPIKEQDISPVKPAAQIQMKQVGVIRPILNTNTKSPPPPPPVKSTTLTDLEIEKNLINRVKSIEQPVSKVVVAIKTLPDSVLLGAVQSDLSSNKNLQTVKMPNSDIKNRGLWSDKKPWHQNQNTMIFNFSDRKDVPDYIENDGLILKGKRDRPRPGEGGFIFLGGSGGAGAATSRGQESSTDDADEDSDDWSGFADPPSPCDVCFVNDNVLINGKSNLRKHPKQRKLRIQFKEEATTFEYPSESSLAEQMGGGGGASGINTDNIDDDRTKSSPSSQSSPRTSPTSSTITSSSSSVPSAPCLGSSNLASYTPSKLGEAEGWQPGITRQHTPLNNTNNNNSNNTSSSASSSAEDPNTNADYLKPATPEQTVAWSEATAADLLF